MHSRVLIGVLWNRPGCYLGSVCKLSTAAAAVLLEQTSWMLIGARVAYDLINQPAA